MHVDHEANYRGLSRRTFLGNAAKLGLGAILASSLPDNPFTFSVNATPIVAPPAPLITDELRHIEFQVEDKQMTFEQADTSAKLLSQIYINFNPYTRMSANDIYRRIFIIETPDIGEAQREETNERIFEEMRKNKKFGVFSELQPTKDLKVRYPDEDFSKEELEWASLHYLQQTPFVKVGKNRLFVNIGHLDYDTGKDRRREYLDGASTGNFGTTAEKFRTDLLEQMFLMTLPEKSPLEADIANIISDLYVKEQWRTLIPFQGMRLDLDPVGTKQGLSWSIEYEDEFGQIQEKAGDFSVGAFALSHLTQQLNRSLGLPYTLHTPANITHLTQSLIPRDHNNFEAILEQSNIDTNTLLQQIATSDLRGFYTSIAEGAKLGTTEVEKVQAAVKLLYTSHIDAPYGTYRFPKWDALAPYFPGIKLNPAQGV